MGAGVQFHPGNQMPFVVANQQRPRSCLEFLKHLYEKIAKAVALFFTYLIACMCCKKPTPVPHADPRVPVVPMPGPVQPPQPELGIGEPPPRREEPAPPQNIPLNPPNVEVHQEPEPVPELHFEPLNLAIPIETPEMPDLPELEAEDVVNLDDLREVLHGHRLELDVWTDELRNQITPKHFLTLLDEFPDQVGRIGNWAIAWAQERSLKIDPNHPYFEIFQEALRNKGLLGGFDASDDYQTYSLASNGGGYYMHDGQFLYIMKSLMGFQELTRPDIRKLTQRLDNKESTFNLNPAYQFSRALSKIYVYPTRINGTYQNDAAIIARIREERRARGELAEAPISDMPDKIELGIGLPWKAYQLAKIFNEIPEFFQHAFRADGTNENCFDARMISFQRFMERYMAPPDFNVDLHLYSRLQDRVLEHFRVCQNEQLLKYAKAARLDYKTIKHWVGSFQEEIPADYRAVRNLQGERVNQDQFPLINQQIKLFFQNWMRPEHFEAYLEQNDQPIKHLRLVWDAHENRHINKPVGEPLTRQEWMTQLRRQGSLPNSWDS